MFDFPCSFDHIIPVEHLACTQYIFLLQTPGRTRGIHAKSQTRYRRLRMSLTLRRGCISQKTVTQDPDTSAWSSSAALTLPWKPSIRPNITSKKDLKAYRRLPKLFRERKFAQNYPLQPFRFLDLPGEVRNAVYRELLVLDKAVENAPKSTGRNNSRAHDIHLRRYMYDIQPRLRFVRTCKLVHQEATSVFYGENEFRFTNANGWYVLSSILLTIGPRHSKLIRSIAIHVGWNGKALDNRHVGLSESNTKMSSMQNDLGSMCLSYKWALARVLRGVLHQAM